MGTKLERPETKSRIKMLPEAENTFYRNTILCVEDIAQKLDLDHRFVGGTFSDLLNPDMYFKLVLPQRTVYLQGYTPLTLRRGDNTPKDLDIVCFTPLRGDVQTAKRQYQTTEHQTAQKGQAYPHVALEETRHSVWKKPRAAWKQMNSGIDVIDMEGERGNLYLCFDVIHQEIPWKSVAPWTVVLVGGPDDGSTFTIFNPLGHKLRYEMRNAAGIKKKDRESGKMILLEEFGKEITRAGKEYGYDYESLYEPWQAFIDDLQHSSHWRIKMKAIGTRAYWDTVGVYFAHGVGWLEWFARQSHRFTG